MVDCLCDFICFGCKRTSWSEESEGRLAVHTGLNGLDYSPANDIHEEQGKREAKTHKDSEQNGDGKRCVFHDADAGGLEGPLKCVEYRDASDRDLAQRFDDYVARGFGLHDFLSLRFASVGSIDYINARGRDDPLIPLTAGIS